MKNKLGLVLEGGAMRGIYSAGVLDYWFEKNIEFDYIIGVSAGAGNAMNYVSRQPGRSRKVIMHEDVDSYYGIGQLFENKKLLNLETLVAEYAMKDLPFDFDTYFASAVESECVVVNCEKGIAEYKSDFKDKEEFLKCNMATMSVPFLCEPIEINGEHYLDGSIVDSIPIKRALKRGCDKVVVVLTKPDDSSATDYSKMKRIIEWNYKRYPALCQALMNRRKTYESQINYLKRMEEAGKVFVIRPKEQLVRHFETKTDRLNECYRHGYDMAREHFEDLQQYLYGPVTVSADMIKKAAVI